VTLDLTEDREDRERGEGAAVRIVPVDGADQSEPRDLPEVIEWLAAVFCSGERSGR
jgi:hypothetical protein